MAVCSWRVSIAVLPLTYRFPSSSSTSSSSSSSIHSNRCTAKKKKKGPLLLAGQKKKKLGSTSLFIHFPLQIQQAFSQLSFSPDHSYGFGYSSESVLSPFVFEDKVHCLKGKGIKVQGKKILKNPTWRDHWGEHGNMCVIFNIVTPGLETGKLLYWQWDCNFVEYLSENTTQSKSISFLSHCRWSSSWMF